MERAADAAVFDLQGRRLPSLRQGLNIMRTADGKTKMIIRK
jgi:hypothetical protein